jgi:hypothetical protein
MKLLSRAKRFDQKENLSLSANWIFSDRSRALSLLTSFSVSASAYSHSLYLKDK